MSCHWPEVDGRSSRPKRKRSVSPAQASASLVGLYLADGSGQQGSSQELNVVSVGSVPPAAGRDHSASSGWLKGNLLTGPEQLQPIWAMPTPVPHLHLNTSQSTVSLSPTTTINGQHTPLPPLIHNKSFDLNTPRPNGTSLSPNWAWPDDSDFASFVMSLGGSSDYDKNLPSDSGTTLTWYTGTGY